jgi:hypothetical protein
METFLLGLIGFVVFKVIVGGFYTVKPDGCARA